MPSDTVTADDRLPKIKNRFKILFFVVVAASILGGCSTDDSKSSKSAFDGRDLSNARKVEVKKDTSLEDIRDISESDFQSDSSQSVRSSGIKTSDGKLLGFKSKILFAEHLNDEADRFDRLESSVQDIRDEFDKMSPSINRLISIESDIKELHDQLKILIDNGSLGKTSKSAKSAKSAKSVRPPAKPVLDDADLEKIKPLEESDFQKEVGAEFLPSLPVKIGDIMPPKPATQ